MNCSYEWLQWWFVFCAEASASPLRSGALQNQTGTKTASPVASCWFCLVLFWLVLFSGGRILSLFQQCWWMGSQGFEARSVPVTSIFFQVKKLRRSCAQDFFARSICFNCTLFSPFLLHVCICACPEGGCATIRVITLLVVTIWLFKNLYSFVSLYTWFPSSAVSCSFETM